MADFVKGLFGGSKPAQAPVVGDDGMYPLSFDSSRDGRWTMNWACRTRYTSCIFQSSLGSGSEDVLCLDNEEL